MDLLPWCALIRVSKHMEDAIMPDPETGEQHYPERNWEKGLPMHSMLDSAMRHLAKYMDGWDDEDHLCAAATNLLMAMWMEEKKPGMQDIPTRATERPLSGPEAVETGEHLSKASRATETPRRASYEQISFSDIDDLWVKEIGD